MTSIIPNKDKKEKQRKTKRWPIVFWLMIWQAASVFVGQEILLASPAAVLKRLFTLVTEPFFWQSLLFSGARIGAGFLLGAAAGIAGAAAAEGGNTGLTRTEYALPGCMRIFYGFNTY